MKMLTQKSVIEKVRLFAQEVNESGITLQRVVLFGSYAKNTQNKWGDIDVALVADNFNGAGFYDVALFGKTLIKKAFRSIQPKTYNTHHFDPSQDPFIEEILRTGIEIETGNPKNRKV